MRRHRIARPIRHHNSYHPSPVSRRSDLWAQEHRLLVALDNYIWATMFLPKRHPLRVGASRGLWSCVVQRTLVRGSQVVVVGGASLVGLLTLLVLIWQGWHMRLATTQTEAALDQAREANALTRMATLTAMRTDATKDIFDETSGPVVKAAALSILSSESFADSAVNLLYADLQETRVYELSMPHFQLQGATFTDCRWTGVEMPRLLSMADLTDGWFTRCDWSGTNGLLVVLATMPYEKQQVEEFLSSMEVGDDPDLSLEVNHTDLRFTEEQGPLRPRMKLTIDRLLPTAPTRREEFDLLNMVLLAQSYYRIELDPSHRPHLAYTDTPWPTWQNVGGLIDRFYADDAGTSKLRRVRFRGSERENHYPNVRGLKWRTHKLDDGSYEWRLTGTIAPK